MTAAARFHRGSYPGQNDYTVLGVGDHSLPRYVFGDGSAFGSVHLEPGTVMELDGCDVEWCGGLDGRDWAHIGYLSQFMGSACNGGRPTRVRIRYEEGPVLALWNEERYNSYRDVVTIRPAGDRASGGKLMDGYLHDKIQGAYCERDMTAYLHRSSHGGPSDPSPFRVVGPSDTGHLPPGWAGYINSVRRDMHAYELIEERYDWGARYDESSVEIAGSSREVVNSAPVSLNHDGEDMATIRATGSIEVSEECSIEHSFTASLTTGVTVEASGGVKPLGVGVDVSVSASIEATVGGGTSKTRSHTTTVSLGYDAPVGGRSKRRITAMMRKVSCTLPWSQVWRNKQNGNRVVLESNSRFERLFDGRTVAEAPVPME